MTRNVRLADLARQGQSGTSTLLSVRLPVELIDRIDALVGRLGSGKAAVVVALLNEGLERFDRKRGRGKRG